MPSGHKRGRKSSKRRSAIQSLNPLPIPSSEENGERAFDVGGGEEEEGEEKFQTPKYHLDPIDLPAASLISQRRGGIKEKMRATEEKSMINEEMIDKNGILDGEKEDGVGKDGILETEEGCDVDKDGILEKEWEEEEESVENLEDVQEVEDRNNEGLKEGNVDDVFGIHDTKEELDALLKEREVKGMHEKKEIGEFSSYVTGTEKEPLIEIARGPLVVKRATIWNCCGLLDVLTGSGS